MDQKVFNAFRDIVYEKSGITLNEKKEALVSARIAKRMRALNIDDQKGYLKFVNDDHSGEEMVQLLDAISTNVTYFFRESEHFEFVENEMGKWLKAGQRRFRFWSAGCSSGEEPYTLAMTLLETIGHTSIDIKILATDISTKILRKSIDGVYNQKRLDDVPAKLRERYFEKTGHGEEASFRASDKLRNLIMFKRLNLSVVPFPMNGPMDIIFCRNVMIYFDNVVRKNLLDEYFRLLKPGGYLLVGHAESLTGMLSGFKSIAPSMYMKP